MGGCPVHVLVFCNFVRWLQALLFGFQWQAIKAGAAVAHESVGGIPLWAAACAAAFVLQLLHGILAGTSSGTSAQPHKMASMLTAGASSCAGTPLTSAFRLPRAGTRQQTTSLNGGIWFAEALFDALVSPAFLLLHVLIALGYTPQLHALNDPAGLRTGATHSLRHES